MTTPETAIEDVKSLTPGEVHARNGSNAPGNKEEFLRAVRGLMIEEQAKRFGALIEESCEQIDE